MTKPIKITLFALLIVCISASAFAASLYAPGLNCTDIQVTSGGFISGFDILPNGNYLINDGYTISEIVRDGSGKRMLYSYAAPVYGSFVRYNSADGKVYFGESSTGDVYSFTYSNPSDLGVFANVPNNFDMDFYNGIPYVVAADAFWQYSYIYKLDGSGTDAIVKAAGPTGPVAFDGTGNMFYIPATYDGPTNILEWSAAQVAGAVGSSCLVESDAQALVGIESGYASTFDSDGGLLFSNNGLATSEIQVYKNGAVSKFAGFAEPGGKNGYISVIRSNPVTNAVCAITSWRDESGASRVVISSLAVPEPSSILALCSLIGLAGAVKLLRFSGK